MLPLPALLGGSLLAAIVHVDDSNQSGIQDGGAQRPYASIQSAIANAGDGDIVKVALGEYGPITTLGKPLTILGGYPGATPSAYANGLGGDFIEQGAAPSATIIDGNGQDIDGVTFTRFDENPYEMTLDNFTVRNCRKGVVCDTEVSWPHPANVTISRNLVEDNGAGDIVTPGAGVLVAGDNIAVLNNIIRNNRGGRGAGIMRLGGSVGPLLIEGNRIERNVCQDDHGGGLMVYGDVILKGNIIAHNRIDFPYGWGGGILMHSIGTLQSSGNVIRHNFAPSYGAGVFVDEGAAAVLRNDLIHHNQTETGFGAGVAVDDGDPGPSQIHLINCTIVYNNSETGDPELGGNGVFADNQGQGTSATVENCVLWGNNGDFYVQDAGAVLTVTHSLSEESWPGAGNLHVDPLFVSPSGDYTLQPGSPGIDAGTNQVWMTDENDLAGNPRIVGARVDLGAYEWQGAGSGVLPMRILNFIPAQLQGTIDLVIATVPGVFHDIQYSLDLEAWNDLEAFTGTLGASVSSIQINLPPALTGGSRSFFRVRK